ncbi:MAG: tetratricopeptide repeat protein [Pyrinomonadaceae bacterium]
MRTIYYLLLVLLLASAIPATAQSDQGKEKKKEEKADVKKGDPPPGAAKNLRPGIARIVLREMLLKRHLVSTQDRFLIPGVTYFESKNIRVNRDSFSFEYDVTIGGKTSTRNPKYLLKNIGYQKVQGADRNGSYYLVYSRDVLKFDELFYLLAWKDERDAQRFVDALNRLIYEVRVVVTPKDDLTPFAADVQLWRDKPESRPVAPDGWDRHRILAEQGIKDKDFVAALVNYEAGIETYPLWAQGWFNAALLYAELSEFESAANRMKHYLLLVPDAPDAKAAREKTIIWEDKAKP